MQVKALVALGANAAILGRRQPTVLLPVAYCFPSAVVFILLTGFVGDVLTVLGYGEGD